MSYEPARWVKCPGCHGSGLVHIKDPKVATPYEPIGLRKCRVCGGCGRVPERAKKP